MTHSYCVQIILLQRLKYKTSALGSKLKSLNCSQEPVFGMLESSFDHIETLIQSNQWDLRQVEIDKLPAFLLVEGYGAFAEYISDKPGLRKKMVLAIEEILIMKHPYSILLENLMDKIRSEIDPFSSQVVNKFRQIN